MGDQHSPGFASPPHRRATRIAVAYLCLVGVPLLGVLGVLRAGQRLAAPVAVNGTWTVQADLSGLGGTACTQLLAEVRQPFLSVAQSGGHLVLTFNNAQRTAITGTLDDAT